MRSGRELALWLMIAACHKNASSPITQPEPGSAAGSGPGIEVAPAAAVTARVELLHGSAATVRVSSQVANKAIKPEHLVDRDFNTAWNSRTGELVGAWIEVTVPAGAMIEELRMTAGHTGKGPKGEDYFTMNPRIRAVTVLRYNSVVGTFKLDIARRDLQALRVHGDGTLRIRVDRIESGSKKSWRETCVSELEAWGTLPAGTKPTPATPPVEVYQPPVALPSFCDHLDEMRAEREAARKETVAECQKLPDPQAREMCGVDEPGDPDCASDAIAIAKLAPPWVGASQDCEIADDIYGPADCTITLKTTKDAIVGPSAMFDLKSGRFDVADISVRDVLPGGDPELVMRYSGQDHDERVIVCRTAPTAECSEPVAPSTALGPKTLVFK